jgi:hypothetical protein
MEAAGLAGIERLDPGEGASVVVGTKGR